jgi:hypothetical protein
MADELCRELEEGLSDPAWSAAGDTRMDWLAGLENVDDCIADGLRRTSDANDWRLFDRYVLAAWQHPSHAYTRTLCDVLGRQSDELNNEDVVGVLDHSRDPAAVGCLRDALDWEPEWDEFRQLAVKAVAALAAIGTPEAIAVLRDAAAGGADVVGEAAARELALLES